MNTAMQFDLHDSQAAGLFDNRKFAEIFGIETKRKFTRTDDKGERHVVVTRTVRPDLSIGLRSEVVR